MTRREAEILAVMLLFDKELVYDRGTAYVGTVRIGRATVFRLLHKCYITLAGDSHVGDFERYTVNGTGKRALREHWGVD